MNMKEYFDQYIYCGCFDSVANPIGCGAADWSVFSCDAYPPFIKEVICNACGVRYVVFVKDFIPRENLKIDPENKKITCNFQLSKSAVRRIRELAIDVPTDNQKIGEKGKMSIWRKVHRLKERFPK
jgi:hypothetical protein